ncbi:MAG: imidazolonepropionase [Blastocatellia bacterium]|nr:imidazolonepropionase [Blastocatellia bacterium]
MPEQLWMNTAQVVTPTGGPACGAVAMNRLTVIPDGAVLVRDGVLAAVGLRSELEPLISPETEVVDCGGGVILPGLVDAHTHPVFSGTREDEYEQRILGKTYKEISAAGGGIRRSVRLTRSAAEEQLFALAQARSRMFLEHGTTTIEGKSGYGLSLAEELKLLRVLNRMGQETPLEVIPTFLGAHEIPDEYREAPEAYLRILIEDMLPQVAELKLAANCDIFCEPHVFPAETARTYLKAAQALGFRLRVHVEQLTRSGGAVLAAELGADSADHLEQAEEEDLLALKSAGVFPVLLPGSVFHLGLKKYPPARRMIELELPVVVASDFNPGSSPSLSLPLAMSLACTQMRMTPAEALTACTLNAAHSLRLGDRIGSLEVGKQADFAIFAVSDYRQIPYFFGVHLVRQTIKRGRLVFRKD